MKGLLPLLLALIPVPLAAGAPSGSYTLVEERSLRRARPGLGPRDRPPAPALPRVAQTQRCVVTNRYRTVHGVRKRVVRLTITLTGTLAGKAKPLRVAVYWPA